MIDILIEIIIVLVIIASIVYGFNKGAFMICAGAFRRWACIIISFALCTEIAEVLVTPTLLRMVNGRSNILSFFINHISVFISFFAIKFILKRAFSLMIMLLNLIVKKGVLGAANKLLGAVISVSFALAVSFLFVKFSSVLFASYGFFDYKNNIIFNGGPIYRLLIFSSPSLGLLGN